MQLRLARFSSRFLRIVQRNSITGFAHARGGQSAKVWKSAPRGNCARASAISAGRRQLPPLQAQAMEAGVELDPEEPSMLHQCRDAGRGDAGEGIADELTGHRAKKHHLTQQVHWLLAGMLSPNLAGETPKIGDGPGRPRRSALVTIVDHLP